MERKKKYLLAAGVGAAAIATLAGIALQRRLLRRGSVFGHIDPAPENPILQSMIDYARDDARYKANLGIGCYRDSSGRPRVFRVVRQVEQMMLEPAFAARIYDDQEQEVENIPRDGRLDKSYHFPLSGVTLYLFEAQKFLFGDRSRSRLDGRIASLQTVGGSEACSIGFEFIYRFLGGRHVYLPRETWNVHQELYKRVFVTRSNASTYRYFSRRSMGLDFAGMKRDLRKMASGSVVLFHMCCHNPTGVDPTPDQWDEIVDIVVERNLFPFVDAAYQGFASGDADRDAYFVRVLEEKGVEMLVAQSFSKNFGLYGERTGCLHVVCRTKELAVRATGNLENFVMGVRIGAPIHGARIVGFILSHYKLSEAWSIEMTKISQRLKLCRRALVKELNDMETPAPNGLPNWRFLLKHKGMFSITGLTPRQCQQLKDDHHVYLTPSGRLCFGGLNDGNLDLVAHAIHAVMTQKRGFFG